MNSIKMIAILLLGLILLTGCAGVGADTIVYIPSDVHVKKKHHKIGPPPHAPAHGYRHKHQHGVELEYDSGIGAYIVVEHPETCFYNGLYLRFSSSGHWIVAAHFDGPWRVAVENDVPPKLKKNKGKGKGKGSRKGKQNKQV